jgi:hypothetical protein
MFAFNESGWKGPSPGQSVATGNFDVLNPGIAAETSVLRGDSRAKNVPFFPNPGLSCRGLRVNYYMNP